jgi:hypothetical protein
LKEGGQINLGNLALGVGLDHSSRIEQKFEGLAVVVTAPYSVELTVVGAVQVRLALNALTLPEKHTLSVFRTMPVIAAAIREDLDSVGSRLARK